MHLCIFARCLRFMLVLRHYIKITWNKISKTMTTTFSCVGGLRQRICPRRPKFTNLRQQSLKAWQPILTARSALPIIFIIGIIFVQVGVLIYVLSRAKEIIIDYTNCKGNTTTRTCADIINDDINDICTCHIPFELPYNWNEEVYMYYALEKVFQNHRMYVRSRDDKQLLGLLSKSVQRDCAPFDYTDAGEPIAPCGAIANSLFNDTLTLSFKNEPVKLLKTGIAWKHDKKRRYHNPLGDLKNALKGFAKPPNWSKNLYELDPEDPENNGFQNEDFIVWMNPAATSSFRKLYRRIDGLQAGEYILSIAFHYPVMPFDGEKKMILSTTTILGTKASFLCVAFLVMGCIFITIGSLLLFLHMRWQKANEELAMHVQQRHR